MPGKEIKADTTPINPTQGEMTPINPTPGKKTQVRMTDGVPTYDRHERMQEDGTVKRHSERPKRY